MKQQNSCSSWRHHRADFKRLCGLVRKGWEVIQHGGLDQTEGVNNGELNYLERDLKMDNS